MRIIKRPASLRLPLDSNFSDQNSCLKRQKLSSGQNLDSVGDGGCLSPTESPRFLGAAPSHEPNGVGPYLFLSPFDSAGLCLHVLDSRTKQLKTAQIVSGTEREHLLRVVERLNSAKESSDPDEVARLRDRVFAADSEILSDPQNSRRFFLIQRRHFGSLHGHVQRQKRLSEAETRRLFRQIAQLVAFCHSVGIVVRDLKLRKFVFVDQSLTELGLCSVKDVVVCAAGSDDSLDDRRGCPAYVSPEILNLRQKSYSGRAADVWSLGVVLFVMLVGRYPFYALTPAGLFGKIREAQFLIPAERRLSLDTQSLVRGLLRRDPVQRPSARSLLAVPWFRKSEEALTAGDGLQDQVVPCLPQEKLQMVPRSDQELPDDDSLL